MIETQNREGSIERLAAHKPVQFQNSLKPENGWKLVRMQDLSQTQRKELIKRLIDFIQNL
jgi:hypothetical protein